MDELQIAGMSLLTEMLLVARKNNARIVFCGNEIKPTDITIEDGVAYVSELTRNGRSKTSIGIEECTTVAEVEAGIRGLFKLQKQIEY